MVEAAILYEGGGLHLRSMAKGTVLTRPPRKAGFPREERGKSYAQRSLSQ